MDINNFSYEASTASPTQKQLLESFEQRLENGTIDDRDILGRFDDNQLEYLQDLKESPEWPADNEQGQLEQIKDACEKFCHNTWLGRYISDKEHWHTIAYALLRCINHH